MGFESTTSKFVEALRIVQGLSDNHKKIEEKKLKVNKRLDFNMENVPIKFYKLRFDKLVYINMIDKT